MTNYASILFDTADGIARITLNRPQRLNSLDPELSREIFDALGCVQNDPSVRVLVLTGTGRGFCSGANLASVSVNLAELDVGDILKHQYNPIVESLRALPIPVVCAVNGVAAGAGANLALACDLVIAARSASFMQAFTRVGLIPDMGGTYFLPHLIGPARALGSTLLAEPIGAQQAADWGMIWACVDDEALASTTQDLAMRLARGPRLALARTKQAIYAATHNSLSQQLALEAELQRDLGRSKDFAEGVTAFLEKRAPRFVGE